MTTFVLHVLPGGNGDALVVEYGQNEQPRRLLVDGGVEKSAAAVEQSIGRSARLELLVVTHIDNDHIAGVFELLNRPDPPQPEEIWFNGFRHLPQSKLEEMGPIAGEKLTSLIREGRYSWNRHFHGHAVGLPAAPAVPAVCTLPEDLKCTVIAPGPNELAQLRKEWVKVVRDAGLDPDIPAPTPPPTAPGLERMGALDVDVLADRVTTPDKSSSNASSIALLVEFADRRLLLSGDAPSDVLLEGIDRLIEPTNTLTVDVFKLPHHGSKANVTAQLVRRVRASVYVFSTDGSGNQRHPNDEAVARVIKYADHPQLAFNYRSKRTQDWDDAALKQQWGYSTCYPADDTPGLLNVDLLKLPPRTG